ncbi:MAG TPA: signal peptidase I [Thermoleophilia bacterium]|nr:signal peptidase I [Thermoleophilia bacterium]
MAAENGRASERGRSRARQLADYAISIAIAVAAVYAVQALAVKPFRIPTPSMADTVMTGDRVLIDRLSYRFHDVRRGDVVVFTGHGPIPLLKRVVGVPGDTLSIRDGRLYVNGAHAPDSYVRREDGRIEPTLPGPDATAPWTLRRPYKVPAGAYFMMGDNRTDSGDSRYWGTVRRDEILGRAFFVYWPPGQVGGL